MKGNARIKSTTLGYEDHGILTCFLHLEQRGTNQGFGGYRLDAPKGKDSIYGTFWITRILETVGASSWEELAGKHVRVAGEDYGSIEGIGHIIEDKWFYPIKEIKAKEGNRE
jgi:hypothetical protein